MPCIINKRGRRRWKATKVVQGHRREKLFPDDSPGSRRAAYQWEAETEHQLKIGPTVPTAHPAQNPAPTPTGCSIIDWATRYLDYCQSRFEKKTYDEKRRAFRRLLEIVPPDLAADDLKPGSVLQLLQNETARCSGAQANRTRKNLRAAWAWGARYLDPPLSGPNPADVERMPETPAPRYIPPPSDFWRVFELCDQQDQTILLTALHTAGRRGEIWRLRRDDIEFSSGQLRLWTRKRRDGSWGSRWIPMTTDLKSALIDWLKTRMAIPGIDPDHVFICLSRDNASRYGKPFLHRNAFLRRMCAAAGVKRFGFHAIRHLTASILYHRGTPTEIIQAILGHASASTTDRYLRSLGQDHVRKSLEDALTPSSGSIIVFKPETK